MPTPQRSTAVYFQQWIQSATAVMQLVQTAVSLYFLSQYWSQPYHTSKLSEKEWVWELTRGYPDYIELGVRLYVFVALTIELRPMGYTDCHAVRWMKRASSFSLVRTELLDIFIPSAVSKSHRVWVLNDWRHPNCIFFGRHDVASVSRGILDT